METKQREAHMDRFISVMKVGHEVARKRQATKLRSSFIKEKSVT